MGFTANSYTDNSVEIDVAAEGLNALVGQGKNVNRAIAATAGINYVAVDNDAPAENITERVLFMGTDNIEAGKALGNSLADSIGTIRQDHSLRL